MIIIEGADSTGKSTLAKQLSDEFNFPVTHSPGPRFSWGWVSKQMTGNDVTFYDRFPLISEQIFGPILREKNRINSSGGSWYLVRFYIKKPLIIYCRPKKETIFSTLRGGEQMDGIVSHKEELLLKYDEVIEKFKRKGFNVVIYDYEHDNINKIRIEVIKWLTSRTWTLPK